MTPWRTVIGFCLVAGLTACSGQRAAPDAATDEVSFRVVQPAVAFELLRDAPETPILDVRSRREYVGPSGHLAGAVNVPLRALEEHLAELDGWRRRTVLVYGRDGEGREAIRVLSAHGFRYPVLLAGGLTAWQEAGFGTVKGARPQPGEPEAE